MNYKELQQRAKELGLPYVGVSKENLEKSIKEKETSSDVVADDEMAKEEKTSHSEKATATAKEVSYNTAIVMSGGREIRRYTLESHGEDFEKLAREFAGKFNYEVKMDFVVNGVKCPNCSFVFELP